MPEMSFAQSYILASKVRTKLTKEAANPKSSLRNLVVQANMLDNLMDFISEETEKRSKPTQVKFDLSTRVSAGNKTTTTSNYKTSITEYELDSESDSDDDEDYYYENDDEEEEDSDSDSDDYYYYSDSDEVEDMEEENDITELTQLTAPALPQRTASYKQLPYINLSLSSIQEEDEEAEQSDAELSQDSEVEVDFVESATPSDVPELCHCNSLTDDEEEGAFYEDANYIAATATTDDADFDRARPKSQPASVSLFKCASRESVEHQSPAHMRHNAIYSLEHVF
ncbi:hypothetical protein PICST_29941 [Scheffersomyces stipitis CBS 6054]|uniref:Uncharacterized protein n=1 Tax=Scheffersomyces stipitis (strain ATCC 58785 / CBS 6054 / NBRC 10063 / NRRL Y-11545) TaxID=322104 RepID=A3LPG8_PICST|nr:hypothetical protein PICST_29941 [Scheffersomyces stipitis CBS 6054]ABN65042.1 hypothetical protein PICST_29941 [Scheffersomyces stipitis CBS 6054]KAG2736249.1 hypothetical protein G9P44_000339 [Scheffersomyces stipitis]